MILSSAEWGMYRNRLRLRASVHTGPLAAVQTDQGNGVPVSGVSRVNGDGVIHILRELGQLLSICGNTNKQDESYDIEFLHYVVALFCS